MLRMGLKKIASQAMMDEYRISVSWLARILLLIIAIETNVYWKQFPKTHCAWPTDMAVSIVVNSCKYSGKPARNKYTCSRHTTYSVNECIPAEQKIISNFHL